MFARVTTFQMKPGSKEAATDLLLSLKDQIMALDGMLTFVNMMNDDGSGMVVSVNESQAQSEANADKVAKIWSHFAEHLAAPPSAKGYEAIANWSN